MRKIDGAPARQSIACGIPAAVAHSLVTPKQPGGWGGRSLQSPKSRPRAGRALRSAPRSIPSRPSIQAPRRRKADVPFLRAAVKRQPIQSASTRGCCRRLREMTPPMPGIRDCRGFGKRKDWPLMNFVIYHADCGSSSSADAIWPMFESPAHYAGLGPAAIRRNTVFNNVYGGGRHRFRTRQWPNPRLRATLRCTRSKEGFDPSSGNDYVCTDRRKADRGRSAASKSRRHGPKARFAPLGERMGGQEMRSSALHSARLYKSTWRRVPRSSGTN